MEFFKGYDENKLKTLLKMACQRIKISVNKKTASSKALKNDIINLLNERKEEMARIKVESMISTDFMIESLSIIELMCELIHERINFLSKQKDCPPDLQEAISSLIYATDRVDIEELKGIKLQFDKKYGAKFIEKCENGTDETCNSRLFAKLRVQRKY